MGYVVKNSSKIHGTEFGPRILAKIDGLFVNYMSQGVAREIFEEFNIDVSRATIHLIYPQWYKTS